MRLMSALKRNTNRRKNRNTNRKPPGHEPDKLVETYGAIAILVDFSNQLLTKGSWLPFFLYWFSYFCSMTKLKEHSREISSWQRHSWYLSPPPNLTNITSLHENHCSHGHLPKGQAATWSWWRKKSKTKPKCSKTKPKEKRTRKPAAPGLTGSTQRCASPYERERESSFMKIRILFLHENHCKYLKKAFKRLEPVLPET